MKSGTRYEAVKLEGDRKRIKRKVLNSAKRSIMKTPGANGDPIYERDRAKEICIVCSGTIEWKA